MNNNSLQFQIAVTPNPNVKKFSWGKEICANGPFDFASQKAAERSPLASGVFKQNGVLAVFVGRDFVSVRKHEGVGWDSLEGMIAESLESFVASGEDAIGPDPEADAEAVDPRDVEARIQKVLDDDIRPAVAMDGGDIALIGFDEGIVTVQLQGACVGCPSSTATLKMGVERRLMAMVPEVKEVVAMDA
ncbi:MAG: NifU family protein [Planctomycetota bacterium]